MNLYIAKNGQQTGPYELAEAQNMVATGALKASDLAWHKGLSGWIPLSQVPGIVATASGQRPVGVWIICGIYLALILWGLSTSLWLFFHFPKPPVPTSPNVRFIVHFDYSGFVISCALDLIKLVGLVLLFGLRRSALYVLGGVFGVSLLLTIYPFARLLLVHGTVSPFIFVPITFMISLNLILLAYVWHLFRKGVLR